MAISNIGDDWQMFRDASTGGAASRPFTELLTDIEKNPNNWEKVSESIVDSTKKGNRGGQSIEEVFKNNRTGETIYKHTLKDVKGNIIGMPHYKPYGNQ